VKMIGLIAGMGALPVRIAEEAVERGHQVLSICFTGFTSPEIESRSTEAVWMKLGQLDKIISTLKSRNVDHVVLAGKIEKQNMLRPWNVRPDRRCLRVVRSLPDWRDDTVLAALAEEFRKDGITVDEITNWASKLMAPVGVMTKKSPTEKHYQEIEFGRRMAQGIGGLDIGQTVVVKNVAVICVEAIEGTDKCILRAKDLNAAHAVVVKMAKPDQDMRFDVPGVGPTTIKSMVAAKAKVLAVEAGKTMITDYDETIKAANKASIIVVGVPAEGPVDNGAAKSF
jgi:UDP-2,3-diacylglucosamine hydrolase